MSTILSEKDRVSYEAFLEEIESWELTLSRESRKIKNIKAKLHSSLLINSANIILTQIDGELIIYRKVRQAKKNYDIIQQYNILSRKFMDIMESIGNFSDQVDINTEEAFDNTIDLNSSQNKEDISPSFQKQTFAFKVTKQPPKSSKKGSFSKKRKSKEISFTQNLVNTTVNPNKSKMQLNSSSQNYKMRGIDDQDSWDIRYQLKEIKSMMSQIKNQIRYHSHEEIETEIQKIQHNNKKMNLELKTLKQDTQYIVGRIQNIKQQLNSEKKIQNQMIQEFENPKYGSLTKSKLKSKSVAESRKNPNQSSVSEVSDWVKVRI